MNWRTISLCLTSLTLVGMMGCSGSEDTNSDNPLVDSKMIDAAVGEFMSSDAVVGLSVAAVKATDDGTLIWSGEYGWRDRDSQLPVDADTRFWMGSVSKAVMGVALVVANENGLFEFDQNVQQWLSTNGLFSLNNPANRDVTIANLVSHTSGIVDNDQIYACAYFVPTGEASHEKLVNLFDFGVTCPATGPVSLGGFLGAYLDQSGEYYDIERNFHDAPPGTVAEYSNIASGLAGFLVESITAQDLATYAQAQIFSPLNMTASGWDNSTFDHSHTATPYVLLDNAVVPLPIYELATWPDGGLRSNARDIAQLLSVVLNNGVHPSSGSRLLSEESMSILLPAADEQVGVFWSREDTIDIDASERELIGHTGSDPGAFSLMFFDPVSRTGIAVAGNGDDDHISDELFENLVADLFAAAGRLR